MNGKTLSHARSLSGAAQPLFFLAFVAVISLALMFIPGEEASAELILVDDDAPDGGDGSREAPYNSIQEAVYASDNGDTVRVYNGTYRERVMVTTGILMIGNGSGGTVIDAMGSGTAVQISSWNVHMNGFHLTNTTTSNGVFLSNVGNCKITNNSFTACRYGIYFSYSSGNFVMNNSFQDIPNGMYLFSSRNNDMINNTLVQGSALQSYHRGIYLYEGSDCTITGNTVTGYHTGVYISAQTLDVVFRDNNRFG